MKFKLIAFVLIFAAASWAQTETPVQSTSQKASEMKCSCCDKTADSASASTEHKHVCMHAKSGSKDSKEISSCCSGKGEASCCSGKDGKACAKMENSSAGCHGEKCSVMGAKGCSSQGNSCCADKDSKKSAGNCCGGAQCQHAQSQPAPGN